MPYYPIFVDLKGRRIIIIGGGNVAEGKVQGLLNAEADGLVVVSPALTPVLEALKDAGKFLWRQAEYKDGDIEGFDICFVATDDGAVNAEVAAESRRRRILVNAADDPAYCDFILPSVVRRGQVVVAASTGGASPALARRLREELADFISEEYADLADLLAAVRLELKQVNVRVDAEVWSRAMDDELRSLLRAGRAADARAHLIEGLGVTEALSR